MPNITGGRVVYGRTVQPAQYESKKAEVELTFGVEEGSQLGSFLQDTADQAINQCHAMLGLPAKLAATPEHKPDKRSKPSEAVVEKITGQKSTGKTKADLEKEQAEKLAKFSPPPADDLDLGGTKPQISTGGERKDPAQADPDGLGDTLNLDEGQAQPITDKELLDAVTKKNAVINNPKAIKEVRAKYTAQSIKDIPQDKRALFLKDLAALTA